MISAAQNLVPIVASMVLTSNKRGFSLAFAR
jgi:hypothetical protein